MTSNSGAALVKKGHPIRGVLWGIMFGLGLAGVLVVTKVIPLDLTQMIVVLAVGIAAGVLWSLFGPAKAPKGAAPTAGAAIEGLAESVEEGLETISTDADGDSDGDDIELLKEESGFDAEAEGDGDGDGDNTHNSGSDDDWQK